MLDVERINRKLTDLEQYKERLEGFVPKDLKSYLKSDAILTSAVERHLQLISDLELDVSGLLYKGLELKLSGDYESILDGLKDRLGKNLVEKIDNRRKLRNSLVHAYIDSNYDKEAFEQAHDTSDLRDFGREIRKIIKEQA